MKLETLAIHAGRKPDPSTGAVREPIHLSTTFERGPDGAYPQGYFYGRSGNPNRASLEQAVAALEGGAEAVAFGSGAAATLAVFSLAAAGGRIVCSADCYHGTARQLREILPRWGASVAFVDTTDLAAVEQALEPGAALLWVETPSNPLLRVSDLAALAALARARGALLGCDNTFASPVLQQPLALGADLVMHSTTKFLGGHSDVLGGMVVAREARTRARAPARVPGGGRRRALALRLLAAAAQPRDPAAAGARRSPPVRWPWHGSSRRTRAWSACITRASRATRATRSHARQMRDGFGAVVSVQVPGGAAEALAVAARVRLFTRATSLGGVESLIEHRASMEGPLTQTPANLLRLAVGLEHPDDLLADLDQSLGD